MEVKFETEKFLNEIDALCQKYGVRKINATSDDVGTITFWRGNEWLEIGQYREGEFAFVHYHCVDDCYTTTRRENNE